MSPLFNPDGTPFVDDPFYPARDPHWELTLCGGCRRWPHKCVGHITLEEGPMSGVYRCACRTCQTKEGL